MANDYSFVELEPVNGSPAFKVVMPIGSPIVLRFCDPHEKAVFETLYGTEHSMELQNRRNEEHMDYTFERMKAEYAYNPDAFADAPEDSFPDERFAPETLIFNEERHSENERRLRCIIDKVVPEKYREYFFRHYGDLLTNTEIARMDGVTEKARRKFDDKLIEICRNEWIKRYGEFVPGL